MQISSARERKRHVEIARLHLRFDRPSHFPRHLPNWPRCASSPSLLAEIPTRMEVARFAQSPGMCVICFSQRRLPY